MKHQQSKEFDFLEFINDEKTKFYGLTPSKMKAEARNIATDLSRRLGKSRANTEILDIIVDAYKETGKNNQKFKANFFKKLYAKIGTKCPKGYDDVGSYEGWDLVESLFFNLEVQGWISIESAPTTDSGSPSSNSDLGDIKRQFFGESAKYNDYSYEDHEDPLFDDDENAQFD